MLHAVVKDLKYLDSHEWVKVEGNSATVGVTDHCQDHLGDVVYIELPEVGAPVSQGDSFGVVESVKATNDINSPIAGKVVEVNEELNDSPGLAIKALHIKWDQANCQANLRPKCEAQRKDSAQSKDPAQA
nr:glycine cleavage system H protein 2, mitochondrial-like isoform X1 [Quercus suber]